MTKGETTSTTTIIRRHEWSISEDDLRALVGAPPNAKVRVEIPGGGDWSGCDIEIDQAPLTVTWEEQEIVQ